MLLTEKKESAKNVGITNDYTFFNINRCRVYIHLQTCTDVGEGEC